MSSLMFRSHQRCKLISAYLQNQGRHPNLFCVRCYIDFLVFLEGPAPPLANSNKLQRNRT